MSEPQPKKPKMAAPATGSAHVKQCIIKLTGGEMITGAFSAFAVLKDMHVIRHVAMAVNSVLPLCSRRGGGRDERYYGRGCY